MVHQAIHSSVKLHNATDGVTPKLIVHQTGRYLRSPTAHDNFKRERLAKCSDASSARCNPARRLHRNHRHHLYATILSLVTARIGTLTALPEPMRRRLSCRRVCFAAVLIRHYAISQLCARWERKRRVVDSPPRVSIPSRWNEVEHSGEKYCSEKVRPVFMLMRSVNLVAHHGTRNAAVKTGRRSAPPGRSRARGRCVSPAAPASWNGERQTECLVTASHRNARSHLRWQRTTPRCVTATYIDRSCVYTLSTPSRSEKLGL